MNQPFHLLAHTYIYFFSVVIYLFVYIYRLHINTIYVTFFGSVCVCECWERKAFQPTAGSPPRTYSGRTAKNLQRTIRQEAAKPTRRPLRATLFCHSKQVAVFPLQRHQAGKVHDCDNMGINIFSSCKSQTCPQSCSLCFCIFRKRNITCTWPFKISST